MAAHTPGPWGWTYDGSSDYSVGPADDPQAKRVANIWDRNSARGNANAALIAAAPDLLAACRAICAFHNAMFVMGRPLQINGMVIDHTLLNEAHRLAEAAIAKAEAA